MAESSEPVPFPSRDEGVDIPTIAKECVRSWVGEVFGANQTVPDFEVYVVWFAYTLGNWKALVSSTLQDNRYYEITYNAAKQEAYLDTYRKTHYHTVLFGDRPTEEEPTNG